jgi:hypothetical protein
MTTGLGPQSKVMIPPRATAATTAAEVQLAGLPSPMTRVGCELSTAWAADGIAAWPSGFPGAGSELALGDGDAPALVAPGVGSAIVDAAGGAVVAGSATGADGDDEHPDSKVLDITHASNRLRPRGEGTARYYRRPGRVSAKNFLWPRE